MSLLFDFVSDPDGLLTLGCGALFLYVAYPGVRRRYRAWRRHRMWARSPL